MSHPGGLGMTAEAVPSAPLPAHMPRSAWSWSIYEGGRDPYLILIAIYVFIPYFATVVVGDAVEGQALVASYGKIAGLFAAFTAPFVGAIADRMARRKVGLMLVTACMVPLIASLWWAAPDGSGISVTQIAFTVVAVSVLFSYSEVLHNALLPIAAPPRFVGGASGWALALANVFGVTSLVIVLFAFALPGTPGWEMLPSQPLLGLDRTMHEGDRIVAFISAGLLAAGCIPLLLFVHEDRRGALGPARAIRAGVADLGALIRNVRGHGQAALFLVSRAFYADGISALALFLGVYAAGVMGWGATQLLIYGICQSIFAGLGGYTAGRLDGRFGPKAAILIEVGGAMLCVIGLVSMSATGMLFVLDFPVDAVPVILAGGVFETLPEFTFLLLAGGTTFFATAASGSSRTMLVSLTPPGQSGAFFGLYALTGKATVWLGPLLVEMFTRGFGSQQMGFLPIAVLLGLGLIGVLFVRAGGRPGGSANE